MSTNGRKRLARLGATLALGAALAGLGATQADAGRIKAADGRTASVVQFGRL